MLDAYQQHADDSNASASAEPKAPHVWDVASTAFQGLVTRAASQSIAINGESGAGKTESCKLILTYLTRVASGSSAAKARTERVARQLHASNPLLEAFGNAKTIRNDNSSRFGKFIRLQFSGLGTLLGASVERYLLEKSRVTCVERGERSFHVFYQLCAGAHPELRQRLLLHGGAGSFRALTRGGCLSIAGINDAHGFAEVREALHLLLDFQVEQPVTAAGASQGRARGAAERLLRCGGLGEEWLWCCLAGLLHLCNVSFIDDDGGTLGAVGAGGATAAVIDDDDQAEDEPELMRAFPQPPASRSRAALATAAALWQVDVVALESAITRRTIAAGAELCELRMSCTEAGAARDALAKATFERTFDALIDLSNRQLCADGGSIDGQGGDGSLGGGFIGLLDIFGTEVFEVNGFEQLLINFANERLQQLFTTTAIGRVQAEYTSEGIPWDVIEYIDNAPVLELLEGKPISILSALDDQGLVAGSTDASFVALLHARFGEGQHPAFAAPRFGAADGHATAFTVRHFAAPVTYSTEAGFLVKNKDSLNADVRTLMRSSALPFVSALFTADDPSAAEQPAAARHERPHPRSPGRGLSSSSLQMRARPRSHYVSVSAQFRGSMASLASTLSSTSCHFIRCIKPNETRTAFQLVPEVTLAQLRSCGVLEAVRVSQAGYPTRMPFGELVQRYAILLPTDNGPLITRRPSSRSSGLGGERLGGSRHGDPTIFSADDAEMQRRAGGGSERGRDPMERRGSDVLRAQAAALLGSLRLEGFEGSTLERPYMLGRTMAFLRSGVLAQCELARSRALHRAISTLQAAARRRAARRRYLAMRRANRVLQRAARRFEGVRWARRQGRQLLERLRAEQAAREQAAAAAKVAAAQEAARQSEVEAATRAIIGEATAALDAAREAAALKEVAVVEVDSSDASLHEVQLAAEVKAARAQVEELTAQLAAASARRDAAEAKAGVEQPSVGTAHEKEAPPLKRRSSEESTSSGGVEQTVEDSVASIMALALARQEIEAVTRDLEASRKEASSLRELNEELREQVTELCEDMEVVQEDKRELEELNYSYEAQLEEYEAVIERREDELHEAANELAVCKVGLAAAKEESLRLMSEVSWLRRRLEERDEEMQRAAETNVRLVERWAASQSDVAFERPTGVAVEIGGLGRRD